QVFGYCDTAALAGDDREGCAVVNHEHRLDRHVWVLITKLDERIDVAEAHVVCAGSNAHNRLDRAGRGIDVRVKTLGLITVLVDPDQKRRRRSLKLEIEAEFNRRLGCGCIHGGRHEDARSGTSYQREADKGAKKAEEAHKPISCRKKQ